MNENETKRILFDSSANADERLAALEGLAVNCVSDSPYVNNHIHTTYSFSPYTPASAVYTAAMAGLSTAGIMDHDSVGGIREFKRAGAIIGMPVTSGFECRVSVKGTALEGRRLNNPDQVSCSYVAMHGIPEGSIDEAERILAPLRERRNERNRKMCENINAVTAEYGLTIDFTQDVLPLSMADRGGSVTERHVLFALVKKLTATYPDRHEAVPTLAKLCGMSGTALKMKSLIDAPDNFYEYDILGILKSSLISNIYVDADTELMHIGDFVKLASHLGAVSAYPYLGDVTASVTGDKKAQKFEDSYLEEVFDLLREYKFNAVTYMPARNTPEQLTRVMSLCRDYGFFQISGEDVNSPRQSFICTAAAKPEFAHLTDATYALIGHERVASANAADAMFSERSVAAYPSLDERIKYFASKAR